MLECVQTVIVALADAVSIPACAACDAHLSAAAVFCAPCAATIVEGAVQVPSAGITTLGAAAQYGGAVATALNRLKHRDRPDLARPLGHLVRRFFREFACPNVDLIVPVPLHKSRLAERRYNQSGLLARELARELTAVTSFDTLERILPTTSQQGLSARARRDNVADAFRVRAAAVRAGTLQGRSVLLVDDVCTTGATLAACAQQLRRSGATSVHAQVVAVRSLRNSA